MPRELVHWHVVKSVLQHPKIVSRPRLFSALNREVHCAFLGSLAHDIPYYYKAGLDPFERIADWMHGKEGEDTFEPMRRLAKEILRRPPAEQSTLWPFLFGMLSHMAADTIFHPVIFYFTGNYNDTDPDERPRAQARHRLFEVYLESWIRPHVHFEWGEYLKNLVIANRERNNAVICDALENVLIPEKIWPAEFPKPAGHNRWASGLKQLSIYQRLFMSPALGAVFRLAKLAAPRKLTGVDALFSFGRADSGEFFAGSLIYRNPVTGEERTETLEVLLKESIERTADYICLFDPLLNGETDVDAVLGGVRGISLNYGLPDVKAGDGRFFSATGVPLPGLRR